MNPAKLTAAAIDAHLESTQESSHRGHLGASQIGKKCLRELWYDWRWSLAERHRGQLLRLFQTGHLYEPRFVAMLRALGVEIWEFDARLPLKEGKPQQFKISDHDGHFGGSLDAVARGIPDLPPGTVFTVSFKTHNQKSFEKLLEMGVMGSKWEHFVQEQMYMHKMGIHICLYLAANKNTDDWHLELLRYDKEVAENGLKRAGDVIYSNEPLARIATSPGAFACKFCHYNRLCHFGDVPVDRNCRTCKYSRPGGKGLWFCGLRSIELDTDAQRAGCGSYQTHSKMLGVQP